MKFEGHNSAHNTHQHWTHVSAQVLRLARAGTLTSSPRELMQTHDFLSPRQVPIHIVTSRINQGALSWESEFHLTCSFFHVLRCWFKKHLLGACQVLSTRPGGGDYRPFCPLTLSCSRCVMGNGHVTKWMGWCMMAITFGGGIGWSTWLWAFELRV